MQFKRIEMQGFKSFADPVCIELNDGITCIVGPNGSGKSNISDALRWVLGEQSPKQLRGNKMDEVIFTHSIDQPFVSQLESKNPNVKFKRIDADLTDSFKAKTSKKAQKELDDAAEEIGKAMKKALKRENLTVKLDKLKN